MKRWNVLTVLLVVFFAVSMVCPRALADKADVNGQVEALLQDSAAVSDVKKEDVESYADYVEDLGEQAAEGSSGDVSEGRTETAEGDLAKACTLSFALVADKAENAISVDIHALMQWFGQEIQVYVGSDDENGRLLKVNDEGVLNIPADGSVSRIYVEDMHRHVLWTGVFSESESFVFDEIGYNGLIRNVPRMEFICYETGEVSINNAIPGMLVLDVSNIANVYGDRIVVQKAGADQKTYSVVSKDESGKYLIDTYGQDQYILIQVDSNKADDLFVWAGKIEVENSESVQEFAFTPNGGHTVTIQKIGKEEIVCAIPETIKSDKLSVRVEALNEDGSRRTLSVSDESSEKSDSKIVMNVPTEELFSESMHIITVHQGDIETLAQVVVLSEIQTPKPDVVDEVVEPSLTLNEDVLVRTGDEVAFSGTMILPSEEEQPEGWELIVQGEPCEEVEYSCTAGGCFAFSVKAHTVAADATELSVYAWRTDDNENRTEAATVRIEWPVIQVQISDYEGVYDGKLHAPMVVSLDSEAVELLYADVNQHAEVVEWKQGLPEFSDAGTYEIYVRAVKEGYRIEYLDGDGELFSEEKEYPVANVTITPASAIVKIGVEQLNEIAYNGQDQQANVVYELSIEKDESGTSELSDIIQGDARWINAKNLAMKVRDAGSYPVAYDQSRFAFIGSVSPNYSVEVQFDESATVVVNQAPLTLISGSAFSVYGEFDGELTNDEAIRREGVLVDKDYYSGDVIAVGSRQVAGISANEIVIADAGEFKKHEHNYDLTLDEGVLIVFPQSISEVDAKWESVRETMDPEDYRDAEIGEIPAFYCGMQTELVNTSGEYNGDSHEIQVRFTDRAGSNVEMIQGVDYEIEYHRGGEETQDLVSAGMIRVVVRGKGNYAGTAEHIYVIERKSVKNAEICIESWIYDGKMAGSQEHPVNANGEPDRYIYRNADGIEISAPVDVGLYTVQAIWDEDANSVGMQSKAGQFQIFPVEVKVQINADDERVVDDPSGLFNAEAMITFDGNEYRCNNSNFNVRFTVSDDAKIQNALARAVLHIDSWYYDGMAAGSDEHPIQASGMNEDVVYFYYDAKGELVNNPVNAGQYRLVAVWGKPEVRKEIEFEILPAVVTASVEPATKIFGERDPEYNVVLEGIVEGETIDYDISRQPGENVGSYSVTFESELKAGNYEVLFIGSTLEVVPKDLSAFRVELVDDNALVYDANNNALLGETDYQANIGEISGVSDRKRVTIEGKGNYSGKIVAECEPIFTSIELTLWSGSEAEIEDFILTDFNEHVSFGGLLESNVPIDANTVAVAVNEVSVKVSTQMIDAKTYRFEVEGLELDSDNIAIDVRVNNVDLPEVSFRVKSLRRMILLSAIAVGLMIAAIVSGVVCIRLGKQIKKERLKLLDTASRQSNRTIRDGQDG